MKISYVHLQFRLVTGFPSPPLYFEASYIKNNLSCNIQEEADKSRKRSSRKSVKLTKVDFSSLSFEEQNNLVVTVKGGRKSRDYIIETYTPRESKMEASKETPVEIPEITFVCESEDAEIINTYLIPHLPDEPTSTQKKHQSIDDVTKREASDDVTESRFSSISFFSGNPAVCVTRGIIQIFKSNIKVKVEETPQTHLLLMLDVPASVDAHGIIEFTSPFCDVITNIRIIRDQTPNQYMVLLEFASNEDACNYFTSLNNKPFNYERSEEICHLAFVASVKVLPQFESSLNDHKSNGSLLQLPTSNTTELPNCMVCLERMDESVRGVLTILCNHSFHAMCLQQWEDLNCPVCRYVQTPEPYTHKKCSTCGALEDLWICLICGNVGCGRYTTEHAQQHYSDTYHNFAMSLADNRVWDYAGDYFVHRLNQKDDGKLVEKKEGSSTGDDPRDKKIYNIQLECMHLLTIQMDSQRKYWEDRMLELEERFEKKQMEMKKQEESLEEQLKEMKVKIDLLGKEKMMMTQKKSKLGSKYEECLKDLVVERELNKSLMSNQSGWKKKVEDLEKMKEDQKNEIVDLKDQLRDVMFFIEARKLIESEEKGCQEDIREGKMSVGECSKGSRRKKKGRKG